MLTVYYYNDNNYFCYRNAFSLFVLAFSVLIFKRTEEGNDESVIFSNPSGANRVVYFIFFVRYTYPLIIFLRFSTFLAFYLRQKLNTQNFEIYCRY